MKKLQNTHSFAKKAIAVCLSIAMIVPAVVANIGGSDAQAADLPTPIATFQAGEAKDYDADGANKPSVVTVEGQTAFTKAWELKNTIIKTEGQEADTDSSVTVVNPFAGMTELHEEWTTQEVDGVQLPIWNNGVTITYWVKAANVENNNSAVISFVSEDTLTYNKDDEAKHRIAVTYSPEKKNDPTSEFYLKICDEPFVDRQGESHVVYNFSAYAKAKGVDDLASEAAVPTLCGYNPEFVEGAYYYCDAVDAEGNPTKKFSAGNCLPMPNSVHKDDATQFATYDINQGSWVRQAYVDGALQLTSDNSFFFGEEMAKGVSINPNRPDYAEKKETGMQQRNNVKIAGEGTATKDTANWYFIAYTITNDYMEAYVNGEPMGLIDMGISDYSAFAQKSFNGGTGFQSPYNTTGASYLYTDANCNAKPLLDWLTMYNTELKIGGASVPVGLSAWSNAVDATREVSPITDTVAGTQIAKVSCYAEVLDDDTIADIYKAGDTVNVPEPTPRPTPSTPVDPTPTPSTPVDPTPTPSTPVDPTPTPSTPVDPTPTPSTPVDPTPTPTDAPEVLYGDVDLNGTVEAADALETLKAVVKLVELTEEQAKAAEVTKDGNVTAEDALEILKKVVKLIDKFPVEA